jgi:hypothetical protein
MAVALFALGVLALSATVCTEVRAQAVDPAAPQTLQRMTDYLGSLQKFSLHTQNTLEDVLDSGHRVDFEVSANVVVSRPNKLQAERRGDVIDQIFYYAGKPLPLGTVVSALPAGCTSTPVGGVEYYYCGGNFYRAVFQGNQLVYVTAKPE